MFRIVTILIGLLIATAAVADMTVGKNSLIGIVTESSMPLSVPMDSQIIFTGLTSNHPTVVWSDGSDEEMEKISETGLILVLQTVNGIGSTDTIYIEKENKRFTVVSVGTFEIADKKSSVKVSTIRGRIK